MIKSNGIEGAEKNEAVVNPAGRRASFSQFKFVLPEIEYF